MSRDLGIKVKSYDKKREKIRLSLLRKSQILAEKNSSQNLLSPRQRASYLPESAAGRYRPVNHDNNSSNTDLVSVMIDGKSIRRSFNGLNQKINNRHNLHKQYNSTVNKQKKEPQTEAKEQI